MDVNVYLIASSLDGAFKELGYIQFSANNRRISRPTFILQGRCARDHLQITNTSRQGSESDLVTYTLVARNNGTNL